MPHAHGLLPGVRVALSPDGRRLASAAEGAGVHVWDVATGKDLLDPFLAHDAPVMCVAFSPDGRHLVTGSCNPFLETVQISLKIKEVGASMVGVRAL